MLILDANVILRYLLRDIPDMAEEAYNAIMGGAATTTEVIAEVVYVLAGVYKVDRRTIGETLFSLLSELDVSHKRSLQYALQLYKETTFDFVDCVLAGYHHEEHMDIMTFDRKLKKLIDANNDAG